MLVVQRDFARVLCSAVVCSVVGVCSQANAQAIYEDSIIRFSLNSGPAFVTRDISVWDRFIAIGDPPYFGDGPGLVNIFDSQSGDFLMRLYSESSNAEDRFGIAVDANDGMVLVGAIGDNTLGHFAGAAYLFDIQTGERLHKFLPPDGAPSDAFGSQVLIHEGMAVVSAPNNDTQGSNFGAVYLFDIESGELLNAFSPDRGTNDSFGRKSVSMEGGVLAVGAWRDNVDGVWGVGSVFLFDVETGNQIYRLHAEDFAVSTGFGESLSQNQGVLAVGARGDSENGTGAGAVYLFDVASGIQLAKVLPSDGAQNAHFGTSVDLSDGLLAVGALDHIENGVDVGAAYVFDGDDYRQIVKLVASDGRSGDEFGFSVFIEQGKVYVAAPEAPLWVNGGAVYMYDLSCAPDMNFDGIVDFFDVSVFIQAYIAGEMTADFVDDGVLNFFDLGAFIGAYAAGCP